MNEAVAAADARLWAAFRSWMEVNAMFTPLSWTLTEHHNNHDGLLQIYLSRNHRGSPFWAMLDWIAEHSPGSYGLFYVHDDEDMANTQYGRKIPEDYINVFRVHRVMNGRVDELADPFFGPIIPNLEPVHPYDRDDDEGT